MPTTRRSSRSSTGAAAAGKQSTLSFKHKVTKAIKTGKEGYKSPARAKEYIPEPSPEPATTPTKTKPTIPITTTDDGEADDNGPETKTDDAAAAAAEITDKAIERYWSAIADSRTAQAVHKKHGEGLATGEKVLRYFDVSSQYGVRTSFIFPSFSPSSLSAFERVVLILNLGTALHRHRAHEALGARPEARAEPARRGAGCVAAGGGARDGEGPYG